MQRIHSSRLEIMKIGHKHFTKERVYSIQRFSKWSIIKKKEVSGIVHNFHCRYYQIYALIKARQADNCIPLTPCRTAFTKLCFGYAICFH